MEDILLRLIYLCTIGCSFYTSGWLVLKAGRNQTTWALTACQALVIVWCLPLLFAGYLTTVQAKYLAYSISYVGISLIGPAWLVFSFRYCGRKIRGVWLALLFGISAADYSIFLSNESHHLFYCQFTVAAVEYGPVFYLHMVFTYLCVVCGMAEVFREFVKKRVAAIHLAVILLAAAVPLGFNFLYLSGVVKTGFDLTPPAFAWSEILMLFAVFRYDFLDVKALAFDEILASVAEGIVVYNSRGDVTYSNHAARGWLGIKDGDGIGDVEEKLWRLGAGREIPEEVLLENGTRIRVRQYHYRNRRGRVTAGALILTDVSEFYETLKQRQELEFSAQRLAVEKERNRIAQEVHDTTGHTLTMIQSLLRLMRAALREKEETDAWRPERLYEYMDQAQELISGGIRELRCSINELRKEEAMTVTQSVRLLADSVKEIRVETEIRGEDDERYSGLSSVVYGVLREAVTNCLKYAGASRMDVIVKFEETMLSLYIFDDGRGCGEIRESNGIRGICSRVTAAGGTVRFLSSEGEGFQIYMSVPVEKKV